MASQKTIKFEFLVDADPKQIDRFHDSLKRIDQTSAVSEKTLTSLRQEIVRFSQASAKTENSLQGQIAALRDVSRNADLTKDGYAKLRTEINLLEREYKELTAGIVSADFKKALDEKRNTLSAHLQEQQRTQKSFADQEIEIANRQHKEMLANNKKFNDEELRQFDRQLENRERKKKERSRRMSDLGDVAQQVGIGAFFGGPEGLAGAAIGGLVGGPAGAMIGTTLGTGAQQLRMQAGMVGTLVAQLNLAKTSLAQVSKNQEDYNQRLTFARQVSSDYALGLESTISGYAKVSAAAAANNLTIQQTESIYRGITSAAVAFGGSQDDIQSAVIATVQVLSKGKVSAEELSGQIGERIPGAVAKFAAANNLSLKELSKALEEGKVNIAQFVKFLEKQTTDYDTIAKNIGNSTAKAGDRLNLELTRSAEIYGRFFQGLGAGFQDAATSLVKWANNNEAVFIRTLAKVRLFVNDFRFEIKVLSDAIDKLTFKGVSSEPFLLLRAGRELLSASTGPAPAQEGNVRGGARGAPGRSAQAGEFSISPGMLAEQQYEQRLQREINRLSSGFNPPGFNRGNSAVPGDEVGGDGLTDKQRQAEIDKQNRLIEQAAAIQRRQDELLAMNKINLAERVYEREQNLIRKKYELEKQLSQARQSAEEAWLTGVQRDVIGQINGLLGRMDDRRRQIVELEGDVERAKKGQGFESQRASVTATYADVGPSLVGTSAGGTAGGGGSGGAYIASRLVQMLGITPAQAAGIVGNMQAESGLNPRVNEGGGVGLPRRRGGYGIMQWTGSRQDDLIRFAGGEKQAGDLDTQIRFAVREMQGSEARSLAKLRQASTPYEAALSFHTSNLRSADTSAMAARRGRNADALFTASGGKLQPGVATGQNRGIKDIGQVEIAGVGVREAQDAAALAKANAQEFNAQDILATAGQMTSQIRQQSEALADQKQELQLRNRLLMEGVRPEIIEQEVERNRLTTESAKVNDALSGKLATIKERLGENSEEYRGLSRIITEINSDYAELIANQAALNEIANAPGAKVRERIGTLKQEINALTDGENRILSFADTIESSLGNAISSAVTEVSFGAGSIREIVIAMLKDISNAVVQSVAQIVAKQGAQSFLSLFGFGGGSGIGSAASGLGAAAFGSGGFGSITDLAFSGIKLFASGGIMTPDGPLPLRTYSRGGIANTPQAAIFGEGMRPEAYVPLPDGRRIPVAMSGGGGQSVNVVVNVDASGSQSVSGNSDEAGRLGRVVSAAVQAELAKQARPGGILAKR